MASGSAFGVRCQGGTFHYSPSNTSAFMGCCAERLEKFPDRNCPQAYIRPMTFNSEAIGKIPTQNCLETNAAWYACMYTYPPFLGCCKMHGCRVVSGCPLDSLAGAALSNNATNAKVFLDGVLGTAASYSPSSSSSSSSSTATATTTVSLSAPTTLSAPASTSDITAPTPSSPAPAETGTGGSIQAGAAAGIAVGAAAVAVGVAALIFWVVRRKRSAAASAAHQPGDHPAVSEVPFSPDSQATAAAAASSKGGVWSSVWSRNSEVVSPSKHAQTPPPPSGPCPPAYQAVATQEASGPVELPTNVCFELPAEAAPRPTPTPGH